MAASSDRSRQHSPLTAANDVRSLHTIHPLPGALSPARGAARTIICARLPTCALVDVGVVLDVDVDLDRDGDLDVAAQALTLHTRTVPLTADAASMLSFQRLDVYQRATEFLALVYDVVHDLPRATRIVPIS
jgi:hypothetical protein